MKKKFSIQLRVRIALALLLTFVFVARAPVSVGAERPAVLVPRSTSGDTASEPQWSQRIAVTVGPEKGDLTGSNDKAIQAAVDYVARLGGGTVKILAGTYRLRNAIYLPSKIRLIGSGENTVTNKEP